MMPTIECKGCSKAIKAHSQQGQRALKDGLCTTCFKECAQWSIPGQRAKVDAPRNKLSWLGTVDSWLTMRGGK